MFKYVVFIFSVVFGSTVIADTQDKGRIDSILALASGGFAIKLDDGIPNAANYYNCHPTVGWAGYKALTYSIRENKLLEVVLAAKKSRFDVTVIVNGCDGSWYKIFGIYIDKPE